MSNASKIPPVPKSVFVYNLLIFNGSFLFIVGYNFFTRATSIDDFMQLVFSITSLVTNVINIALPLYMFTYYTKLMRGYEDIENGIDKANRAINNYQRISISVPIFLSLVVPLCMHLERHIIKPAQIIALTLTSVGCLFLVALFFYILFTHKLEAWAYFVPFRKKDISLSYQSRSLLTAFFSISGVLMICIPPFLKNIGDGMAAQAVLIRMVVPLGLIGLAAGMGDIFVLSSAILRRIENIEDFTEKLSQGNYKIEKLKVLSRDEFGLLVNDLNTFHESASDLLLEIKNNTQATNKAAQTLSQAMTNASSEVNHISRSIKTVQAQTAEQVRSVEETQSTVSDMASSIRELSGSIDEQSASVIESSSSIEEMVANLRSVAKILEQNAVKIDLLSTAAEKGQEAVERSSELASSIASDSEGLLEASSVIQHIASQTNLLAMNAAIEAAHAGESGKGFAVVADEIRKLAEESSEQGKSIALVLTKLKEAIGELASAGSNMQTQFGEIFKLTGSVQEQGNVVMSAIKEQDTGSTQVLEAVRRINDITVAVRERSAFLLKGSQSISTVVENLGKLSGDISSSMHDMTFRTSEINGATDLMEDAVRSNHDTIARLASEVEKFTV